MATAPNRVQAMTEHSEAGEIFGSFLLNRTETVAAYRSTFGGKDYVHIRVIVPSAEADDEWIPTSKGVAIQVDRFDELHRLILKLWDATGDVELGRLEKSSKDAIVVSHSIFKGTYYCQVRSYFKNEAGKWLPTKKGVAVPSTKLQSLDELLERVAEALRDH